MGKVYRRKRHSCGLCKPNKVAGAPARSDRERMEEREAEAEARQATRRLSWWTCACGRHVNGNLKRCTYCGALRPDKGER